MKAILLPLTGLALVAAASAQATINEFRVDQAGTDNDEYFELLGAPGTDLTGLTYIVIGDGSGASGTIECVIDLTGQTIPASGFFVCAESTFTLGTPDYTVAGTALNFENSDNVTHLLVSGFTGANADDLDTDDDGILDVTPWTAVVDSVALMGTAASEMIYSTTVVGPDGTFVPGHVFLCSAGWEIGQFDVVGGQDTPGAANACAGPVNIVSFCDPANNNSTGFPVNMTGAFGSGVGSDLHLEATGGPNAEFGYFLIGTAAETAAPLAVSNGLLCLSVTGGNSFGRYNIGGGDLNSVGQFDASGVMQNLVSTSTTGTGYDVPLAIPLSGATTIMAGETWHFQMWYRDGAAGAGTSNLSNGLSVTF
ncbi:MAG: hypothetical protein H6830_07480 [Planctomycetes bacterium]|nr:hypothetical protein [Planctomycetota bacterium]MCB9910240.1 hypothetical protein [Planctomycetota bacterium]